MRENKLVTTKFNRREKIALTIVSIIDLMSFCSISFMSLFLPQDTAQKGETFEIFKFCSIKFSVLTTALTAFIFGITVPKFGVKNVFVGGVILSRISTSLFGTLHHVKDEKLFTFLSYLLRGFESMGECAYVIGGYVIVLSIFPEDVGMIRGILEAIVGMGSTIGPAVGELIIPVNTYGQPYYCVGLALILFAILGSQLIDNPIDCHKNHKSFKEFLQIPGVIVTSIVVVVGSLSANALDPTLHDYISTILPQVKTGHVFLLIAAAFAVSSGPLGYLSEKLRRFEWMLPAGLFSNGLLILFIDPVFTMDFIQFPGKNKLIIMGLLGAALALAIVPTFHCLTKVALEKGFKYTLTTHSYVISTWTFMFAVGEILGPNLGQFLYKKYNFAITAVIIALINFLVGIVCTVFFYCKSKNRNFFGKFNVSIYFY